MIADGAPVIGGGTAVCRVECSLTELNDLYELVSNCELVQMAIIEPMRFATIVRMRVFVNKLFYPK